MKLYKCEDITVSYEYGPIPRLRVKMLEDHKVMGGRTGEWTITPVVKSIDFERKIAVTQNSIYYWE